LNAVFFKVKLDILKYKKLVVVVRTKYGANYWLRIV